MIEVTPDTACMLYVGGMVITLFWAWFKSMRKDRKKDVQRVLHVVHCEFCASGYTSSSISLLSRCPNCGLINKIEN